MPEPHTPLPFSAAARARQLEALAAEQFDLLVVGGGITGVGIAFDAACRGLSVALVEGADFASGTSGASSRLIHGGLRYLENLDFHLVFEALAERRRLLRLAPHLVQPLDFLFPVFRGDAVGPLKLRAGMWMYDLLALFQSIRRHRMLDRTGALRREPRLAAERLRGGAVYYDAQVDDARLTLAVARGAHDAGACVVPRAPVRGFLVDERGRVRGARVEDTIRGGMVEVRAHLVVSATGPWTDELRRLALPAARPRLRPTKGVHVVFDRERVGNTGAIIFPSSVDGRVMFVLPWGRFTYVGTTDTDVEIPPDEVRTDEEDVRYLIESVNALFPAARLTPRDVVGSWVGVRPLLDPGSAEESESQTSREHEIWRDASGLFCVAGGKLTTYRGMAADAVDRAAAILKREHGVWVGHCSTADLPLPGTPAGPWEGFLTAFRGEATAAGLDPAAAEHLARAYGDDARGVLELLRAEADLAAPILPPLPYLRAEIVHAVRGEMALTLEDVMRRRMHLTYEAPDGALAAAQTVARLMARQPELAWSDEEVERQLAAYRDAVGRTRPRTGG